MQDELLSLPEKVVLKVEDLIRCIKAAQQGKRPEVHVRFSGYQGHFTVSLCLYSS
jgi:hypothetical protein